MTTITQKTELEQILANASIEVMARDASVAQRVRAHFPPGADVHVTFLPDDTVVHLESGCVRLSEMGYNPVPHLTARNIPDRGSLERNLARLSANAGVSRALLIGGDVDRPRGEFSASVDVMRTGLLERYGIRSVRLAGHPEGHPAVEDRELDAALLDKIAYARDHGLSPEIVTQFCFEAEPILDWLRHIRALGIDAPVRLGVAGPAGTATLLRFAVRCGIGNSLRALRRPASIGKLIGDTTPDEVLGDVADRIRTERLGPIAGIHIYMFGGIQKTAEWLARARHQASLPAPTIARSANP